MGAEIKQTVRKLAICAKMVDQNEDFRVKLNFGRSKASIFEAKARSNLGSRGFSHGLLDFCTIRNSRVCDLLRARNRE